MIESYPVGLDPEQVTAAGRRAATVAERMRRLGVDVRLVESTLVPEEDALFCLFDAPSRAVVEELAGEANLPLERLVEVLDVGPTAPAGVKEVEE